MSLKDQPFKWYAPKNTDDGSLNAWANDPCSILYDKKQKLYYSWILFRNGKSFPSGWVEMISSDLNEWTQTDIRIKEGREFFQVDTSFKPSAMGGTVWIDEQGRFFDKGDVVFLISMQECKLMNNECGSSLLKDSGIAYYVSHGLGQPIYKAGVLASKGKNPMNNDWRDPYIYETDKGLYFAISARDRIEFWKINSFRIDDIKKIDQLYVRSIGVEVPNVIRFGENTWYISCSVQDAPKDPPEEKYFQSSYWYLCNLIEEKFKVYAQGQHEYGTEGYAQRVVNPWLTRIAPFAISRTMPGNWGYDTDIWDWKGGCYGSEKLTVKGKKVYLTPYDWIGDYSNNGTAVYKLKVKEMMQGYHLKFDKGEFIFYLKENKITWNNNFDTKLVKWTTTGGVANENDDIIIIWNKTTLTFYNITEGWNAHFMLPQGIIHTLNDNAMGLINY